MTEILIRDATVEDADALGDVHVRAGKSAYRGVMPDEYLDGLDAVERVQAWRRFFDQYESSGWAVDGTERKAEVFGVTIAEVRYRRPLDRPT